MTSRKKAFISAYINDVKRNQTAAAIAAGYSEKSAAQAASRLMRDPEVKAAVEAAEKERHEQNTAKAEEVTEFLTSVMRGEKVDSVTLYAEKGVQNQIDSKAAARDRLKAAELLGKYYGLFDGNGAPENEQINIKLDWEK